VIGVQVRFQIGQMHKAVTLFEKRVPQSGKNARFVPAEVIGENQVQRRARLGLVFIMPMRVVPAAATAYLIGCQAEQKEVLLPRFLRHLDGGAVAGAWSGRRSS